jgi:uncharacterized protein
MSRVILSEVKPYLTSPPHVLSLHRYPVKSMLGEQIARLEVDQRGCVGDRLWSIRTTTDKIGSGKGSRRFAAIPKLLELRAQKRDGTVVLTFPGGSTCTIDAPNAADRVSDHVGQPVTLAMETEVSHYDDGPVSLIGSASVLAVARERGESLDPARFRANLVLDTIEPFLEDKWVGRQLKIGSAILSVTMTSPRCVMVDMKTGDLPEQPGNLKAVGRVNDACLGVIATVVVPGTINQGNTVEVR